MNVDAPLGDFGDVLFYSALAVYVLAMLLHAVEHGLLRRPEPAREAVTASVPAGVAAPADEPGGTTTVPDDPASADEPRLPGGRPPRPISERFGRMGVSLTVLGAALHLAMLLVRGVAAGRPPWGNMYEFVAAVTLVGVVAWLVVLSRRPELRRLGVFVLLPVIVLMFLGGTVLYTQTAPVVPALHSYWLAIHVTAAVISSGILLVAGVASVLYLLRSAHDSSGRLGWTALAARVRGARPCRLPRHGRGLPDLDVRRHRRRHLGRGSLGPVLGLGPQGDRPRSSPGSSTRATCTRGRRRGGGAGGRPRSTSSASR